mmetsp:Transcript_3456/g.7667  ORF Transcript_3456/g.7667 Transcript_3456/m.7667 type:complete len:92 (-) Transcript_3456:770-1045(-)
MDSHFPQNHTSHTFSTKTTNKSHLHVQYPPPRLQNQQGDIAQLSLRTEVLPQDHHDDHPQNVNDPPIPGQWETSVYGTDEDVYEEKGYGKV